MNEEEKIDKLKDWLLTQTYNKLINVNEREGYDNTLDFIESLKTPFEQLQVPTPKFKGNVGDLR